MPDVKKLKYKVQLNLTGVVFLYCTSVCKLSNSGICTLDAWVHVVLRSWEFSQIGWLTLMVVKLKVFSGNLLKDIYGIRLATKGESKDPPLSFLYEMTNNNNDPNFNPPPMFIGLN